jgi:hypothetical protein
VGQFSTAFGLCGGDCGRGGAERQRNKYRRLEADLSGGGLQCHFTSSTAGDRAGGETEREIRDSMKIHRSIITITFIHGLQECHGRGGDGGGGAAQGISIKFRLPQPFIIQNLMIFCSLYSIYLVTWV